MSQRVRYLTLQAGAFRLALPIDAVRQILDAGGSSTPLAAEALPAGAAPIDLARVLGSTPHAVRPATLVFERPPGTAVLSVCKLGDVLDVEAPPRPLPRTVACRWPGLIRGVIDDPIDGGLRLVLEAPVLLELLEAP